MVMENAKITRQKITVEIEDLTWDNLKEKIAPVFEIERKLEWMGYEICVGLTHENFDRLMRTAPYLRGVGAAVIDDRMYHIIYGFPIILRD